LLPGLCGFAFAVGLAVAGAGASAGGVREVRFGGGAGFGTIRRVITPWPVVQRLVVSQ
jgi:hypothetical protein